MPETITSLIEKLEGAEVGSRELDCAVARVVGCYKGFATEHLSTSLDAALALAERVLPGDPDFSPTGPSVGWKINLYRGMVPAPLGGWIVNLRRHATDGVEGQATTAALALCAAILRAKSEARV